MRDIVLRPHQLGFIVATRAALAFGIGLLVSKQLSDSRRRGIGKTLVAIGVLSTIPAALLVTQRHRRPLERR